MKLNIITNMGETRDNYLNIIVTDSKPCMHNDIGYGEIHNLDYFVDDAECEEIIINKAVDYVPPNLLDLAINTWLKKLMAGGVLTIIGVDSNIVANHIYHGKFNTEEINKILYANFDYSTDNKIQAVYKKSILNANVIQDLFVQRNLHINYMSFNDLYYIIKVIK